MNQYHNSLAHHRDRALPCSGLQNEPEAKNRQSGFLSAIIAEFQDTAYLFSCDHYSQRMDMFGGGVSY